MGVRRPAAGALRAGQDRARATGAAGRAARQGARSHRRLAQRSDAAQRARDGQPPHGRLPRRQARVREPPGRLRERAPLRARRTRREEAGGAARLWPRGDRQGPPALPADRRPPGAPGLRRPVLGPGRAGRAQPVLGPRAGKEPLQPRLRRARGARQPRDARRHQPRALHGLGRDARGRLPAGAERRGRREDRDHRHERGRLPVDVDRGAGSAHPRGAALVLSDGAADANGEPHLRGPGQRSRAGPAGPGVRGHRPPGIAAARVPAPTPPLRGRARLLPDRGHAQDISGSRLLLPPLRPRRPGGDERGLPQAPVLGREPDAGVRVSRPRVRKPGSHDLRSREDAARRDAALRAVGTGPRGPRRPLARRRDS